LTHSSFSLFKLNKISSPKISLNNIKAIKIDKKEALSDRNSPKKWLIKIIGESERFILESRLAGRKSRLRCVWLCLKGINLGI